MRAVRFGRHSHRTSGHAFCSKLAAGLRRTASVPPARAVDESADLAKHRADLPKAKSKAALKQLEKEEKLEASGEAFFVYVAGAFAVGMGIYAFRGFSAAEEYFAAYLLEQSLSIDNLFVFVLCFEFFRTPKEYQDKVLGWGIWSAAVLRGVMILAGVELVENFKPLLIVFALILLYSSGKILLSGNNADEEEDLSQNLVVKGVNKVFTVTDGYRGDRFFCREADVLKVTPLFVTLAVIEISDVIFAVDSIPAVFGVTLDPLVIYTSNIAAILSLRALFGFVATVISELRFLDKAVALVLAFIGGKMIADQLPGGMHVPTSLSLAVVALLLGGGTVASLLLPEPEDESL